MIVPLFISLILGYLVVASFLRSFNHLTSYRLLAFCLAVGAGFGISSCLYFCWLLYFNKPGNHLIIVESIFAVLLLFLLVRKGSNGNDVLAINPDAQRDDKLCKLLSISFYSMLLSSVLAFSILSFNSPHGAWDACVIYNLRARFLFRGGELWREAFSPLLYWPYHVDYPLLIPTTVARCWEFMGKESQAVPALIGMFFTFATVGLATTSISILKSKTQGYLAGIVILGSSNFIIHGTSQYADVPLGFFMLAVNVLITTQDKFPRNRELSILAGLMAGFACWTKNEGALFYLSVILGLSAANCLSAYRDSCFRNILCVVGGSLPVLILLIYFKIDLVSSNDLMAGYDTSNLADLSRYFLIYKSFIFDTMITLPLLPLLLIYLFFYRAVDVIELQKSIAYLIITLSLVFTGYFLVYLLSPYNLKWHLSTSLSRLLLQLWPSIVFTIFLLARSTEQGTDVNTNASKFKAS